MTWLVGVDPVGGFDRGVNDYVGCSLLISNGRNMNLTEAELVGVDDVIAHPRRRR